MHTHMHTHTHTHTYTFTHTHIHIHTHTHAHTFLQMVFVKRGETISGGNFHGEYPAKALDYLAIAIHEVANMSERRLERLIHPGKGEGESKQGGWGLEGVGVGGGE